MVGLNDGHIFPRDERKSMIFFKDWLSSADYMSDADFRAAITAAVKYGTEGITTEAVIDWIKDLDKHLYHTDVVMFWFLGIKGSIDKPYDDWQRKKDKLNERKNRNDIQP